MTKKPMRQIYHWLVTTAVEYYKMKGTGWVKNEAKQNAYIEKYTAAMIIWCVKPTNSNYKRTFCNFSSISCFDTPSAWVTTTDFASTFVWISVTPKPMEYKERKLNIRYYCTRHVSVAAAAAGLINLNFVMGRTFNFAQDPLHCISTTLAMRD